MEKIPLVSVIIPMYNSSKFIPQTLESLLYQTMKDFEVVVVDDCSTDNSVEVVESFKPRFDSENVKLHVIKLPKNTGAGGLPRNAGINFACGKYIDFLDSDDLLTRTALEELAELAEKSQADVVHTDTFLFLCRKKPLTDEEYSKFKNLNELLAPANLTVCHEQRLPLVSQPVFETEDLAQRIRAWINRGYNWESVTMFCRRSFLVGNQIYFPKLLNDEDKVFSFWLLCSAKKFLRVPNLTYIYRQRTDSVCNKKFSDFNQYFYKWFNVLHDGINEFEEIMNRFPFFTEYLDYRYAVLEFFFNTIFPKISSYNLKTSPFALNDLFKKEFHSDEAVFSTYLIDTVNIQRLQIMWLRQELAKFQKQ